MLAGAPGFEPGITGSKPVALPLGYAPKLDMKLSIKYLSEHKCVSTKNTGY